MMPIYYFDTRKPTMANLMSRDENGLKSCEIRSVTLLNVASESGFPEYKRLWTRSDVDQRAFVSAF